MLELYNRGGNIETQENRLARSFKAVFCCYVVWCVGAVVMLRSGGGGLFPVCSTALLVLRAPPSVQHAPLRVITLVAETVDCGASVEGEGDGVTQLRGGEDE